MNILLFGSEGNLGEELYGPLAKKFNVICIDLIKKKNLSNKKFIRIDLSKTININKFNKFKSDIGIILSFYKTMPVDFNKSNKKEFKSINKKILTNALKICKINKVEKIIHFSSAAVYSENYTSKKISEKFKIKPINIFAKFKLYAERKILKFCKKNNIKCMNFRLFNYYSKNGNILIANFKKQLKKKEIFINGDGNQSRDFLHINDMLKAIEGFINKNIRSSTCNLCSGNATKIKTIINKLINNNKEKKTIINYTKKNQSNFYLVGNNEKLKKLINWKVTKNFNNFI